VVVTGDLQRNWGWLEPGVDWRTLGVTTQFPTTADLASRMWAARTGQHVQGVLAVDVVGLRQIMTVTGPVQVGGTTLDASNVVQYLLHDQYAGLSDNATGDAARQDALGTIAGDVLRQLQGQSADLRGLASAVSGAVAGRHLMVWSTDPTTEAAWVASGAAGTLTPSSLTVNVINQGGNKLDQFLPVSVHLATRTDGSDTALTMTTTLTNRTPAGESQFVAGPFPGLPLAYGDYSGVVADNLPAAATHISMAGAGPLSALGTEGPTVLVAAPVVVHQGATATVVVRFQLPGTHGSMTLVPSTRVPAVEWTYLGTQVTDDRPVTFSW
jgi:hypothetical protein